MGVRVVVFAPFASQWPPSIHMEDTQIWLRSFSVLSRSQKPFIVVAAAALSLLARWASLPFRRQLVLRWRLIRAALALPEGLLLSALEGIEQHLAGARDQTPVPYEHRVLAVDIGGTRTKFLLVDGRQCVPLPAVPTARIWQNPSLTGPDRFEPHTAPVRMDAYLREHGVDLGRIGRLAFAVPGTIDLAGRDARTDELSIVKNTPSMSPKFRGFDFKEAFRDFMAPSAKVSAVADNLAAALGVACQYPQLRSALVIVLGTAPAVASLFRDPSGKGKYIETGIWQSWVWFTKVKLDDPYGYCGGLRVTADGVQLKPATAAKIPHHQARIRFALDDATWQRLRGCCDALPAELQFELTEAQATEVWSRRLQSAVNALAERFHSIYGPPEHVHVLGGNAIRCRGAVTKARYNIPDSAKDLWHEVPVIIPRDDAQQQLLHMSGLLYASCFKLKQVTAPGQDPLARGWTRGGEICLWVAKGVKSEHEVAWPPCVHAVRDAERDPRSTKSSSEQLAWSSEVGSRACREQQSAVSHGS